MVLTSVIQIPLHPKALVSEWVWLSCEYDIFLFVDEMNRIKEYDHIVSGTVSVRSSFDEHLLSGIVASASPCNPQAFSPP